MNAPIETPSLETVEDITDAFDSWSKNPSTEMRVRGTTLGTIVLLFEAGQQVAVGRGRGLANAIANAFEEMGASLDRSA